MRRFFDVLDMLRHKILIKVHDESNTIMLVTIGCIQQFLVNFM